MSPSLSFYKIISNKGPNIYDIHTEGDESWNLSHVYGFYCFYITDLLLIIANWGGGDGGGYVGAEWWGGVK